MQLFGSLATILDFSQYITIFHHLFERITDLATVCRPQRSGKVLKSGNLSVTKKSRKIYWLFSVYFLQNGKISNFCSICFVSHLKWQTATKAKMITKYSGVCLWKLRIFAGFGFSGLKPIPIDGQLNSEWKNGLTLENWSTETGVMVIWSIFQFSQFLSFSRQDANVQRSNLHFRNDHELRILKM